MREAYECVQCSVPVQKIDSEAIARIRRGLVRPQRTKPKSNGQLIGNQQLSPRSQRRKDDSAFAPPIPHPIETIDVESMDSECECIQSLFFHI